MTETVTDAVTMTILIDVHLARCLIGNLLGEERGYSFAFEDGVLGASAQREFEYTGEECSGILYVNLPEEVTQGFYSADFFIDGTS